MVNDNIDTIAQSERHEQIKSFIGFAASIYVIPLFLAFSIADYIWYNNFFTEFLIVRLVTAVSTYLFAQFITRKKHDSALATELSGLILIILCGTPINYMIYRIGDPGSPYYAGLILVAVGLCVGLRLSWKYHFSAFLTLIIPYITIYAINPTQPNSYFLLNLIFFISVVIIGSIGKAVYEMLIYKELTSRYKLNSEVANRGKIIEEKTIENTKLSALSKQFSPQIIESIKSGEINLSSKVHESEIAVIFVDIVNSTKNIIKLKQEDSQEVISNFINDVMSIFLMYDVTIDKFLGDGFMGFTNQPLPRKDYVERAILASYALLEKIKSKNQTYDAVWKSKFEVRISIAVGKANIGFYGNDKYLKTFTAIGRPVILASRLNSAGKPSSLVVSEEVIQILKDSSSTLLKKSIITKIENLSLKGFENEQIVAYNFNLQENVISMSQSDDETCPHGHGLLTIEVNTAGIYELKCRFCNYSADQNI